MNITLKAKHYRLIACILKRIVASDSFNILAELKNKVSNTALDDDIIQTTVNPKDLIFVYPKLSELNEGLSAEINKEMDYMLRDQMIAGVIANDTEWIEVKDFITQHKAKYTNMLQSLIDEGKLFLNGTNN